MNVSWVLVVGGILALIALAYALYQLRGPGGPALPPASQSDIQRQAAQAMGELPSEVQAEIAALLQQGRKIQAIKHYRDHTQAGLAEAKKRIEAIQQQLHKP